MLELSYAEVSIWSDGMYPNVVLLPDEVHVWCVCLDLMSRYFGDLKRVLSEDEVNRAWRFHFEQDRIRFVITRGMLRVILSWYLGRKPGELYFCYNKYGKPALADMSGDLNLNFNVSHSERLALCAITAERKVGVDIESIHPFKNMEEVVMSMFSKQEKEVFSALPEYMKQEAFFNCWTRKEAYTKAVGRGLSYPLNKFSVSMMPDEPARLLEVEGKQNEECRWALKEISPAPGYVAAVAAEEHSWHVRFGTGRLEAMNNGKEYGTIAGNLLY